MPSAADETDDWHSVATTVFELAGQDTAGLLADVTQLLTSNGCDVRSAAVRGCAARDSPCIPAVRSRLLHTSVHLQKSQSCADQHWICSTLRGHTLAAHGQLRRVGRGDAPSLSDRV